MYVRLNCRGTRTFAEERERERMESGIEVSVMRKNMSGEVGKRRGGVANQGAIEAIWNVHEVELGIL